MSWLLHLKCNNVTTDTHKKDKNMEKELENIKKDFNTIYWKVLVKDFKN